MTGRQPAIAVEAYNVLELDLKHKKAAPADSANNGAPGSGRNVVSKRQLTSQELLGGSIEPIILHEGDEYRLRLTTKGKLILTM